MNKLWENITEKDVKKQLNFLTGKRKNVLNPVTLFQYSTTENIIQSIFADLHILLLTKKKFQKVNSVVDKRPQTFSKKPGFIVQYKKETLQNKTTKFTEIMPVL